MTDNHLDDTNPDHPVLPSGPSAIPQLEVEVGGRTHTGLVRATNEDNFHIVRFGRFLRTVLSSLPADHAPEEDASPGYGFAVADGMGGHVAGAVASRAALAMLVAVALQTPDWILGRDDELMAEVMERTARRFHQVNEAVRDHARTQGLRDMGTTLSLALSLSDALIIAHVGDSRAYLFRGGKLHRLTRDHTVGEQIAGRDPAAAARLRHVLTRCIGGYNPGCEPDVAHHRLVDGDRLLLCTDGLTDMVVEASITREMGRGTSSDEVCRTLIDLALECGGRDNVTVIVATYRHPAPPSAPPGPPSPA
jgi:PPM family protein phosphatase